MNQSTRTIGETPADAAAGDDLLLPPLDGRPGPARRLSSPAAARLVQSILDAALDGPDEPTLELPAGSVREAPPEPRLELAAPPASPWWRNRYLLAASVLVAVSAGTAGAVALRLHDVRLGAAELTPDAPVPIPARRPRPLPAPPREPDTVAVPPEVLAPEPAPQPARPARKPAAVAVARPEPPPVAPPPPPVVVPQAPPEDLLASANDLRKRRAWRDADAFYAAVVGRFAGSDAAMVAEVASAALHLQHLGDAAGALASYRRTLRERPAGPLAEEARWGLAEAHRVLGDARSEAVALSDFLDHHPHSAFAPAARRRLARIAP